MKSRLLLLLCCVLSLPALGVGAVFVASDAATRNDGWDGFGFFVGTLLIAPTLIGLVALAVGEWLFGRGAAASGWMLRVLGVVGVGAPLVMMTASAIP